MMSSFQKFLLYNEVGFLLYLFLCQWIQRPGFLPFYILSHPVLPLLCWLYSMTHLSLLGFRRVSMQIHAFFSGSRILLATIVLHVHAKGNEIKHGWELAIFKKQKEMLTMIVEGWTKKYHDCRRWKNRDMLKVKKDNDCLVFNLYISNSLYFHALYFILGNKKLYG